MGKKFTKEELAAEKHHIQIIGLKGTRVIATAVLVPEEKSLKMQRVVVDNECRSLEIGSNMMVYCEHYALNNGFNLIYCHARDSAVNFYLKNDYLAKGDAFDEDGIPHLKMKKQL
ncbi:GNAT family N-acetyltransferase [Crocinitomix sp.]|nr:GNAT family N-acetyltransferase [Crocinitomix sp.]